ncbi:hypothetical protein BH11BAC7_BH11BAC7_30620 [soil metagenome]
MKGKPDAEKNIFLLYEVVINAVDNLNIPFLAFKSQLELLETRGVENSKPEEIKNIFSTIRQTVAELNEFKTAISELILNRTNNLE